MPAVYDDEKQGHDTSSDDLNRITGINKDEEKQMEDRAHDGAASDIAKREGLDRDDLKSAEESATTPGSTDADSDETNQLGQGYTGESGRRTFRKRFFTRRKAAAGGAVGVLIGGAFGAFTILHGPLQLLHFGQLLQGFHFSSQEDFMDGRAGRFIRNIRSGDRERSRLGRFDNKIADRFEARFQERSGLRSMYDANGRLSGYEVIDRDKSIHFLQEAGFDENSDFPIKEANEIPSGTNAYNPDGQRITPTGPFIDLSDENYKSRRVFTRIAVKGTNTNKVAGSLASRLLIKRAGVDFHPLKNVRRKTTDSLQDYYRQRREERARRHSEGVNPLNTRTQGTEITDDEGNVTDSTDDIANDSNEFLDDAANAGTPEAKNRLVSRVMGGGFATAIVGALCVAHDLGDQVPEYQFTHIILPMIRMGSSVVTMTSQVMNGNDVNLDEVGSVVSDFYDEETQQSWIEAKSIQAELGRDTDGPDIPPEAKPSRVGEKPFIFDVLDAPVLGSALDKGCGLIDSAISRIPLLGDAVELVGNIANGAINFALKPTGKTLNEYMYALVGFIAGDVVNTEAAGAELGNLANYGALLAANDQAIATGGRSLTDTEVAALDAAAERERKFELSQQSMFARVFNVYNVDSMAGQLALSTPRTPNQALASMFSAPLNAFANIFSPVQAQEVNYDYGVDEFGFSLEEQNDPRFEDPFTNAAIVEPKLAELNEEYGECFNLTIEPSTSNLVYAEESAMIYADRGGGNPEKCDDSDNEELLRYRFYIADTVTKHTLLCYEGDKNSCQQLGIGAVSTNEIGAAAGEEIVGDPYTDSSGIACAPGTKDLGIQDGYVDGNKFSVRLCSLSNLPSSGQADNPGGTYSTPGAEGNAIVNSRVSGAWYKLVEDAKAEGINFSASSSFRSMPHQESLWYQNPDSSLVARPGNSSHQAGVAIDFSGMGVKGGSTCTNRARMDSNPAWVWLLENAENYGFEQYAKEAWHWDALQANNRCNSTEV